MENIVRFYLKLFIPLVGMATVSAQNTSAELLVNGGNVSVGADGILSTGYDFSNLGTAHFISDGQISYQSNFHNDGVYGITNGKTSSKTLFSMADDTKEALILSGNGLSSFYDITFDNPKKEMSFDVSTNIDLQGQANMKKGVIKINDAPNTLTRMSKGMISFLPGATAANASDDSHIQGLMEKVGREDFDFPQGDGGFYRPATISSAQNDEDTFVSKYVYDDKGFFEARTVLSGAIDILNKNEYWLVERGVNTSTDIILTLGWHDDTTSKDVLGTPEKNLRIVRWDEIHELWIDEGGIVDMVNKKVTTPTTVDRYGFFTLATIKEDWIIDVDIAIYNLVSPNGDGKNDYFVIDNISRYPNNTVEIYNRWGTRVFETSNYDAQGYGTVNVFDGYAKGRVVVNKDEPLPSGTYYYIIVYEINDEKGSRTIKKSGYLHLDTP
ncbi:gliding motility-associated C-terminal domain-containing protein [Myroides pelagicus]|uniref:T9SS type B sorting domain-containing protein n=1 Tax=Myroides pelagicus TaxID=270914 RepID=A0A7K1GST9_9FLAO|nr:gliding motility-associated C-terminal domain-containing protein [Myroides pelagicus]MTH30894.1 T9SS type B sorting domain-containing protein [Myroides pelagicus]